MFPRGGDLAGGAVVQLRLVRADLAREGSGGAAALLSADASDGGGPERPRLDDARAAPLPALPTRGPQTQTAAAHLQRRIREAQRCNSRRGACCVAEALRRHHRIVLWVPEPCCPQ